MSFIINKYSIGKTLIKDNMLSIIDKDTIIIKNLKNGIYINIDINVSCIDFNKNFCAYIYNSHLYVLGYFMDSFYKTPTKISDKKFIFVSIGYKYLVAIDVDNYPYILGPNKYFKNKEKDFYKISNMKFNKVICGNDFILLLGVDNYLYKVGKIGKNDRYPCNYIFPYDNDEYDNIYYYNNTLCLSTKDNIIKILKI